MTTTQKKQIQVSIKSEASEILAKLAKKCGLSLSSVTAKILEEKLLDKPRKKVNNRKNKRTARFLQRLKQGRTQPLEGIEAAVVSESTDTYFSKFKIVLTNTSTSGVDIQNLVVIFPVDDKLKNGLALETFNSTGVSYPDLDNSTLEIQGENPSIAVTSVRWTDEDWVDTELDPDGTFEIIYEVSSNVTQADLDAVIAGNIQVSTGTIEYKLTILTPEKPEGVTAPECTFSVHDGNSRLFTRTISWNSRWESDLPSAGTYTVQPEDITEGGFLYQGIDQTRELTASLSSQTVTIDYEEPVQDIAITLTVEPQYASYTKIINFIGINGNSYQHQYTMDGAEKTVEVLPGEYNISASSLTIEDTSYIAQLENPYNLTASRTINIEYEEAPDPLVKGWPNYIAHGAVTQGATSVTDYLQRNPVDAIFRYAGVGGNGDPGQIIEPEATLGTVEDSRDIEAATGKSVMPVMVVYTIEGSGSGEQMVADLSLPSDPAAHPGYEDYLWKHYVNLSTIANTLQSAKDTQHPYPGSIILNPDALGMLQQNPDSSYVEQILTSTIAVNENLATAIQYLEENYGIPVDLGSFPSLEDNFKGYVQSLHALIRAIAPDITFGWQVNLWAGGSSNWIHETLTDDQINTERSQPLVNFWNAQEVYNGQIRPDFIVFDKYERDCFDRLQSIPVGYAFNANDWSNYMVYAKQISEAFGVPCMYWQIPGGHMPLVGEDTSIVDNNHSASAPDFFFGNSGIGTDINNISSEVLQIDLPEIDPYHGANTVGEYLRQKPHDWSNSQLEQLANNNVFAILWGGGQTTSIAPIGTNGDDQGWLAGKVSDYYDNPQYLG